MPKIRVPDSLIPHFKTFCKCFSHSLEPATGIRLRGNRLAKAAGHSNYKALLIDAGKYGDGHFDWYALPTGLAEPLVIC